MVLVNSQKHSDSSRPAEKIFGIYLASASCGGPFSSSRRKPRSIRVIVTGLRRYDMIFAICRYWSLLTLEAAKGIESF